MAGLPVALKSAYNELAVALIEDDLLGGTVFSTEGAARRRQ